LKDFQEHEVVCYQQSPAIKSKYKESIYSSYDYYTKFLKKQKDLLKIFEKANKQQIKMLCNNKDKIADQQNKQNQKMNKNFNNLKDLTQKRQQQEQQKKKGQKENKEQNKKDAKKDENEKKNKMYNDKVQSLEEQNKNLIGQIQKIKTQDNYDPLKYIKNLFKEFYANDEDFKKGKRQNSV